MERERWWERKVQDTKLNIWERIERRRPEKGQEQGLLIYG